MRGQREENVRRTDPARRHFLTGTAAALAAPFLAHPASAQAWPTRPVRVIIPYPPAGGADTVGRIYFTKLGEVWGQQFVIDNRGGAGGTIAEAAAAKAEPDGYNILYDATAFSVNPFLYPKLSFDYIKDFQPVFLASLVPNILVVNKDVPAKTVADVIALAKAAPDGIDFASSGNGTVQHLSLEMFRHMTGTRINHIPYRGGGPALNDVIGGQVKFFFSNGSASIGQVQAGAVKAIAHTGRGRLRTAPDLPPVSDTIPGFEAYEWNGVFVPTGTPGDIIGKLNAGLNAMLKEPAVTDRLDKLNVDYRPNTPDDFRAFVAAEMEKWSRVVKEANIKLG
ncbi:MAG: tripartite tricarboxylate transporter substrate binding protein [Alphaproteobacteria bacterium]|nr:MAG: tripartite tricarboxylate transporter substrate binding protein [Alphaproteobacteria bacterium]